MNKYLEKDNFRLFVKIMLSLAVCIVYSIPAAFICFYIPRVWADSAFMIFMRRLGLVLLLILLLAVGIFVHYLICSKLLPFKIKKHKIIYIAVSFVFMNPYVWYLLIYLISYIPGTGF